MSPQQRGQDAQTTDLAVILTPAVRSALRPFALEEKAIGVINVRPHRNLPTSTTCIILFILKPVIFSSSYFTVDGISLSEPSSQKLYMYRAG